MTVILNGIQVSGVRRKFSRGVSFCGVWWSFQFVFGVRCLWRHNLTSYSCSQTNVFAKFVDTICTFCYTHSPYFMCDCTEYKLSALQVTISEENKLNATTQQFIMAKIPGCALKQGSKTHSSLRQSDLQLQNQAARMSYWIRAVELRKCAAGLSNASSGLQDRILLNYTRIENAHKVRKKTFGFLLCIDVQQSFIFPFSLNASVLATAVFELVQQFYHATEIGSRCGQRMHWSAIADKAKTIVSDKVNYRGTQS